MNPSQSPEKLPLFTSTHLVLMTTFQPSSIKFPSFALPRLVHIFRSQIPSFPRFPTSDHFSSQVKPVDDTFSNPRSHPLKKFLTTSSIMNLFLFLFFLSHSKPRTPFFRSIFCRFPPSPYPLALSITRPTIYLTYCNPSTQIKA